jgi:hypothetical protein
MWLRDVFATISDKPIYNYDSETHDITNVRFQKNISEQSELSELSELSSSSQLNGWFTANDIYKYLWHTTSDMKKCNKIITIYVPSLRLIYWRHRKLLSNDELVVLESIITDSIPRFIDLVLYGANNYELDYSTMDEDITQNTPDGGLIPVEITPVERNLIEGYVRSARKLNQLDKEAPPIPADEYKSIYQLEIYNPHGFITPFDVVHISVKEFVNRLNSHQPLEFKLSSTNVYLVLAYRPYDFYDQETKQLLVDLSVICPA